MPLDPHVARFLRILEATRSADASRLTAVQRRNAFRHLMQFSGDGPAVGDVRDMLVPGPDGPIPIRIYTPINAPSLRLRCMIYFHGGGLVAGGLDTHDAICRVLCNESGCRWIAVDYRLAPEHPFPAAITDSYAATTWIMGNAASLHVEPKQIAVGGDSAGATLAAAVCQMFRQNRCEGPAWQLLLCPIMDYVTQTKSRRTCAANGLISQGMMDHDLGLYLPSGVTAADPRISPLQAGDLHGLPPAFIHTAEFDPLRDEGKIYADRLRNTGIEVHYTCHAGMVHLFYALGRVVPYACTALSQIGADIRNHFGTMDSSDR
jgi:acetyl esterase/lipase